MNYKQIASNFSVAVLAQATYAIASALLTLVLPKMLGIEDFGYWQLFIFYAGYVGLFHLGLNDGVYLQYGGRERSEIDKRDINSQFIFSLGIQLAISVILMSAIVMLSSVAERAFVLLMATALISVNNAGIYFGYLFQAMNETKLFSISVAIESCALLLGVVLLMLIGMHEFEPYVLMYFATKIFRLAYCVIHVKDFFDAGLYALDVTVKRCIQSVSIGIKLMIANLAGSLILGIARFCIDGYWGVEAFSEISLALSITSFFMTFISQASMVLFPALRQSSDSDMRSFYANARDCLNYFLPVILLFYYPAARILELWLPDYASSLVFFSYVLPICLFEGKMDILGTTYLKVLRREDDLLKINLFTMVVSAILSFVGVLCFQSIELVLLSVVFVLGARELFVERYISRLFNSGPSSMSYIALFLSCCFIGVFNGLDSLSALFIYALLLALYLFAYRSIAFDMFRKIKSVNRLN